jgi:hypothetical protein
MANKVNGNEIERTNIAKKLSFRILLSKGRNCGFLISSGALVVYYLGKGNIP